MGVTVGAHVIKVSGELHFLRLLAERLPDSCRFLGTASHRHVSAVMELIPRPAERSECKTETSDYLACGSC